MSYSRWSESVWYTYWAGCPKKENRNTAVFEICWVCRFTAIELRENLDICLDMVRERSGGQFNDEQIIELKLYVAEFLDDVDREYPETLKGKVWQWLKRIARET